MRTKRTSTLDVKIMQIQRKRGAIGWGGSLANLQRQEKCFGHQASREELGGTDRRKRWGGGAKKEKGPLSEGAIKGDGFAGFKNGDSQTQRNNKPSFQALEGKCDKQTLKKSEVGNSVEDWGGGGELLARSKNRQCCKKHKSKSLLKNERFRKGQSRSLTAAKKENEGIHYRNLPRLTSLVWKAGRECKRKKKKKRCHNVERRGTATKKRDYPKRERKKNNRRSKKKSTLWSSLEKETKGVERKTKAPAHHCTEPVCPTRMATEKKFSTILRESLNRKNGKEGNKKQKQLRRRDPNSAKKIVRGVLSYIGRRR